MVNTRITLLRWSLGGIILQDNRSHTCKNASRIAESQVPVTSILAGISLLWLFTLAERPKAWCLIEGLPALIQPMLLLYGLLRASGPEIPSGPSPLGLI